VPPEEKRTAITSLCRAPEEKRTAITSLCRAPPLKAHGNHCPLPCAAIKNAGQTFSKKIKKTQSPCSEGHVDMLALITVYTN
jgi:hypothetical protein